MRREELDLALLRRLMELHEHRETSMADAPRHQPTHVYVSEPHFRNEFEHVFRGRPLVAGLSADLPTTGSFFTVEVAEVPLVVTRQEDGTVRAFLNACRHRGSRVAEGRGHPGRVFKCPYHAWVYDLKGELMGQPTARDGFASVDNEKTGLIDLPAREHAGLILVRMERTDSSSDLVRDMEFNGLDEELKVHEFESFAFFEERHSEWRMNWKQPYETFLEAYHIFALHQGTLAKEVLSTPMLTDAFGPHGRGVLMGRRAKELADRPEEEWERAGNANIVHWIFPNTVLSLPMTGHAELWQFYPVADSPMQTQVHVRFYTPEPVETDKERNFWERMVEFTMGVVTTEDLAQQELIHKNIRSGSLPELIFGRNEPALIHYHEALAQRLPAAETSGAK